MSLRWLMLAGLVLFSPAAARPVTFPDRFDSIGTPLQNLRTREGRTVHFTDTGERGWKSMLFIGGVGTSARAPELVAFLDTLRRQLKVRIIAVERNGLGDTAYDPAWTFADYTSEVRQVLGKLGIQRFALVAISGGGAYAGHIAAAMPERLTSWHMLAAIASAPAAGEVCGADQAQLEATLAPQVGAPRVWWDLPAGGVAAAVRGFADRAADEGARAFFIAGQHGDARSVAREYKRFCDAPAAVAAATLGTATAAPVTLLQLLLLLLRQLLMLMPAMTTTHSCLALAQLPSTLPQPTTTTTTVPHQHQQQQL